MSAMHKLFDAKLCKWNCLIWATKCRDSVVPCYLSCSIRNEENMALLKLVGHSLMNNGHGIQIIRRISNRANEFNPSMCSFCAVGKIVIVPSSIRTSLSSSIRANFFFSSHFHFGWQINFSINLFKAKCNEWKTFRIILHFCLAMWSTSLHKYGEFTYKTTFSMNLKLNEAIWCDWSSVNLNIAKIMLH